MKTDDEITAAAGATLEYYAGLFAAEPDAVMMKAFAALLVGAAHGMRLWSDTDTAVYALCALRDQIDRPR